MTRLSLVFAAGFAAFALSIAHAETHILYPIDSARTSPSSNWGSCCGTSSFAPGSATISVNSCTYQGGYCMGDSHRAVWLYEMPQMSSSETITLMALVGTRSGSTGSGVVSWRWMNTPTITTTGITDTLYSPDASQSINWSGSSNFSITTPPSMFMANDGGYIMVTASISSEYAMNFSNNGSSGTRLVFYSEPGCPSDFDSNGSVDVTDLLSLLGVYGTANSDHDLDGDDMVGVNDLLHLLDAFGECQ